MKTKIEATKLSDATATHVSLVERGANRIPFRIVKQENGMIDLTKIFKGDKAKKQDKPVSAIVIQKSDMVEDIKAALQASGFDVSNVEETENGEIILKQEDFDMKEVKAVKMGEMVLLTKSFSAYNLGSDSSFTERVSAMGFFPNLETACYTFVDSVANAMYASEDGSELATKVSKMLTEFQGYVSTLVGALPTAAFKAEKDIAEIIAKGAGKDKDKEKMNDGEDPDKDNAKKDEEIKGAESTDATEQAAETAAAEAGDTQVEKAEGETADNPAETTADNSAAPAAELDVAAVVQKSVEAALAPVLQSVTELATKVDGVQQQVLDVAKSQDSVASKVSEVEKVAKAAQLAVKGTVIAGSPAGDNLEEETTTTRKSDNHGQLIDTAYPGFRGGHRNKH